MPPGPLSKRALRSNAITLQESVPVDLCHVRSTGVNGGVKVGRVGGRLLSIDDLILYRLPSFIGL